MEYTTVDRILYKFNRDLKNSDFDEADIIGWVGEALEFIKVQTAMETIVSFREVKDYHVDLPVGTQAILMVLKNSLYPRTLFQKADFEEDISATPPVPISSEGSPTEDYEFAYFRPTFDLQWEYNPFYQNTTIQNNFTPVRLSNSVFFNSIVCKEKIDIPYQNCRDEYTIVGTVQRRLRFSFKEGQVAISYVRIPVDEQTGFPLIPDEISTITAITYYVEWKIAEWYDWNGRAGFNYKAQDLERKWLKYIRQAINYHKKPKTIDDYQDLLEQTHHLIPNMRSYYSHFKNVNSPENRNYLKG